MNRFVRYFAANSLVFCIGLQCSFVITNAVPPLMYPYLAHRCLNHSVDKVPYLEAT